MSAPTEPAPPGLLLSDDLIFASRITGTARGLGLEVRQVRAPGPLAETAGKVGNALCDRGPGLSRPGPAGPSAPARRGLRPAAARGGLRLARGRRLAARRAGGGLRPTLPRSKFVEDLPRELPTWLAGPE